MDRAMMAAWELPDPLTDTNPTSFCSGTMPSMAGDSSSAIRMLSSG